MKSYKCQHHRSTSNPVHRGPGLDDQVDDADKNDNAHESEVSEGQGSKADNDNNDALDDEAAIKLVLDASGNADLKVEVRSWKDLWKQHKEDIVNMHKKQARLTTINQLLLLHNFATLWIKGIRRIVASQDIAWQWHDSEGTHFAHHVHILACHYQVFEQLPTQIRGGYDGHLVFSDEHMQNATWNWLTKLPTGEVSPRHFCRALTKEILPCLGINKKIMAE